MSRDPNITIGPKGPVQRVLALPLFFGLIRVIAHRDLYLIRQLRRASPLRRGEVRGRDLNLGIWRAQHQLWQVARHLHESDHHPQTQAYEETQQGTNKHRHVRNNRKTNTWQISCTP